jgi:hypothetical protein
MKGNLIQYQKFTDELGNTVEMKLWKVPVTEDKPHGFKYSLVYIVNDQRVIGYDNHERKGDHRHFGKQVEPYRFENIEKLREDFFKNVLRLKEKKSESEKG